MTDSGSASPFTRRGFVIAALAVAVLALCAVAAVLANLLGGADRDAAAPPAGPASSDAVPAAAASICGLPGYQPTGSLTEAPATKWVLFGRFAVPDSRNQYGPGTINPDGLRTCYAHNPTGVLYAAANLTGMSTDSTLRSDVIRAMVASGPGQEAALAGAQTEAEPSAVTFQVAAFRVTSYTGDRATVDLVLRASNGAYLSFVEDWVWQDGDWKIVYSNDGSTRFPPQQIASLGGYIPWAGA